MSDMKELLDRNERLLLELGYMQGEMVKIDLLKERIAKLESDKDYADRRNEQLRNRVFELLNELETARRSASEAIRLLQVDNEYLKHELDQLKTSKAVGG